MIQTPESEADLIALVTTAVQENIGLDYKESRALANTDSCKNEISKDVSAFANSAGGIIIYGIAENGHVPIKVDEGVDGSIITKEWLEQVISSRIQRKIDGCRVIQIRLNRQGDNQVAYVISVPQSNRAPHQASDKKFYKRYNFQSAPMEEYEIRDVARRFESPNLKIVSRSLNTPTRVSLGSLDQFGQHGSFDLALELINESIEPAHYALVSIFLQENLSFISTKSTVRPRSITIDGKTLRGGEFQYVHGNDSKVPIFSGLSFTFMDARVRINQASSNQAFIIEWQIKSPKMAPALGRWLLRTDMTNQRNPLVDLVEV